jgi:hypothetical protein
LGFGCFSGRYTEIVLQKPIDFPALADDRLLLIFPSRKNFACLTDETGIRKNRLSFTNWPN